MIIISYFAPGYSFADSTPNPADHMIHVIFDGNWRYSASLKIYDTNGRVLYFENNAMITIPHLINLNGLNKGIYFIEVYDLNDQVISCFILK